VAHWWNHCVFVLKRAQSSVLFAKHELIFT